MISVVNPVNSQQRAPGLPCPTSQGPDPNAQLRHWDLEKAFSFFREYYTLPKTDMVPENMLKSKKEVVPQPSIFKGYVGFRKGSNQCVHLRDLFFWKG